MILWMLLKFILISILNICFNINILISKISFKNQFFVPHYTNYYMIKSAQAVVKGIHSKRNSPVKIG